MKILSANRNTGVLKKWSFQILFPCFNKADGKMNEQAVVVEKSIKDKIQKALNRSFLILRSIQMAGKQKFQNFVPVPF